MLNIYQDILCIQARICATLRYKRFFLLCVFFTELPANRPYLPNPCVIFISSSACLASCGVSMRFLVRGMVFESMCDLSYLKHMLAMRISFIRHSDNIHLNNLNIDNIRTVAPRCKVSASLSYTDWKAILLTVRKCGAVFTDAVG